MSETHKEQAAYLDVISEIEELPEVNEQLFKCYSAIEIIKNEFANIFDEIALYEERMTKLKERAGVLFEIEDVKTLPDSGYHGTLTRVAGKRYIPIRKAQEMLEPKLYASLVETGKGHVRWTPPKEV
jgi:uncharacterized protein YlzI (FlbEa/FlbD family)